MRILMIHNRYGDAARGGAERVVERLVGAFQARGHTVDVYHRTTIGFNALSRLPAFARAVWHLMDLFNIVAAVHLRATLRPGVAKGSAGGARVKPDVVHTHNLIGCGGLTPWVIRRSGIPWVHTLHDVQLITPSGLLTQRTENVGEGFIPSRAGGYKTRPYAARGNFSPSRLEGEREGEGFAPTSVIERSFLGRWFRSLRRFLFGSPLVVTSPSHWLLQLHRAEQFFPDSREAVVGNPIESTDDADQHANDSDTRIRTTARSAYPHHLRVRSASSVLPIRTFLFVGQVEGVKGVFVLVEAHRQLRALFPDIGLQIIGDGTAFPILRRMTRDIRGLVVRGRLDSDGVQRAIAEVDVLVVPSLCAENQPSAILEAFAAGVPVVASRVGGIPELVRDGETGFLTDPGSVEDLVRVLRLCVEDPRRVRGMSAACLAIAEAHAAARIAKQFEALYTPADGYAGNAARQSLGSLREG